MNRILILAGILVLLLLIGIASAEGGTSYVYGANGQRIAKINETGVFYTHSDNLGSTSAITNSKGEVIEEQLNLPFGEPVSGDERYGFTGKEQDGNGLQYFGARYYSPETGRFISVDPELEYFSPYLYVGNNPLTRVDPDGRKSKPIPWWKHWWYMLIDPNYRHFNRIGIRARPDPPTPKTSLPSSNNGGLTIPDGFLAGEKDTEKTKEFVKIGKEQILEELLTPRQLQEKKKLDQYKHLSTEECYKKGILIKYKKYEGVYYHGGAGKDLIEKKINDLRQGKMEPGLEEDTFWGREKETAIQIADWRYVTYQLIYYPWVPKSYNRYVVKAYVTNANYHPKLWDRGRPLFSMDYDEFRTNGAAKITHYAAIIDLRENKIRQVLPVETGWEPLPKEW